MRSQMIVAFAVACTIFSVFSPQALSQDLHERLLLFQPMLGKQWIGHYVGSSDSDIEHSLRWESILNCKAVKSTKEVAALHFSMETYYFWNGEKEVVSFLELTNRGTHSTGTVRIEEGRITRLGLHPNSITQFK